MSFFSTLGNIAKTAAPFIGAIPGVGPIAAGAIGLGGSLLAGNPVDRAVGAGLTGAAGGEAGNLLSGKDNLSDFASRIGSAIKDPKTMGAVAGLTNMMGVERQRRAAQGYNNSLIDQRNDLMSKILSASQPNYGSLTSPNLNQQSSATSGGY